MSSSSDPFGTSSYVGNTGSGAVVSTAAGKWAVKDVSLKEGLKLTTNSA
jgi:hypothetical protein